MISDKSRKTRTQHIMNLINENLKNQRMMDIEITDKFKEYEENQKRIKNAVEKALTLIGKH